MEIDYNYIIFPSKYIFKSEISHFRKSLTFTTRYHCCPKLNIQLGRTFQNMYYLLLNRKTLFLEVNK